VAADSIPAGLAVVDAEGAIRWVNAAWTNVVKATPVLAGTRVGLNLIAHGRLSASPLASALAASLEAVLAGASRNVQFDAPPSQVRQISVTITPLRSGPGAVIMHAELGATHFRSAHKASVAANGAEIAEHLTTRELQVLTLMADGRSNRAIGADLGIEYTTVRGYVQSLLHKLDARSRVEAVALAYRAGLVWEIGVVG
jgi:DNA-binding NarL/FixJ family response regulator